MAYKEQNTADSVRITYDRGVSPVWARLLHKGVENRGKLKSTLTKVGESPELIPAAFLGKSLLDRFIDPTLTKLLPDSVKADVLRNKITFSPGKKTQLGFKLDKKNPLLSVNMKF